MAAYDFKAHRLFMDADLRPGEPLTLDRAAANYLLNVLRLGPGDSILVFNGRDGEWRAALDPDGRKSAKLVPSERVRDQTPPADLVYLFAPLKHARLDYVVQKAVEMGAGTIAPVLTRRTVASRVNLDRMRANAVEAAEQCGILSVPAVLAEERLDAALDALESERALVFCDEDAERTDPLAALATIAPGTRLALLVGPEGGFAPEERERLVARPNTVRISLGPRILRADTAAVAALALIGPTRGDWL